MAMLKETNLWILVEAVAGTRRTESLFEAVAVPRSLLEPWKPRVPRAQLAMALNLLLFGDLVRRVPWAQAYVGDRVRAGGKVVFDHGALRTVLAPSGPLVQGRAAFTRLLEPLGYREAEVYPLERLRMTGHALVHRDLPEEIPQFFLSELHAEAFSPAFQEAVARTLASSRDPLPLWAISLLEELRASGGLPQEQALRLLPNLVACFDRQHGPPRLDDYRTLLAESEEMAWIATEGHAFNHVTDRVPDVEALAQEQRALGRPMKDAVEVAASGRIRQTAFRAAQAERPFRAPEGHLVLETVPGSFYEFITRLSHPDGRLDLGFDSGNAQGIFKMTAKGAT
jgi:hypothetical protein